MADRTTPGSRGVAPPRARVVALAALLILGILGMHALAQHCAASASMPVVAAATSEELFSSSAATGLIVHEHAMSSEPLVSASALVAAGLVESGLVESGLGGDQPAGATVMLCAVMLVVAGTALFRLLGFRRGWPRGWWRGWSPDGALRLLADHVPKPVDAGPPYVVNFAVIRC